MLQVGSVYVDLDNNMASFKIRRLDHVIKYLIPILDKYPLFSSKHLNYLDFNSAAKIIKNKEHLNSDGLGLEKIL